MSFASSCPHCKARFKVKDESLGKNAVCPKCYGPFIVERAEVGEVREMMETAMMAEVPPEPPMVTLDVEPQASAKPTAKPPDAKLRSRTRSRLVFFGAIAASLLGCCILTCMIGILQPSASDASKGEMQHSGNMYVRIKEVYISQISYSQIGEMYSLEKHLRIEIVVANFGKERKQDYDGWGPRQNGVRLADEFGNEYSQVYFGFASRIHGQLDGAATINPGYERTDVLVFQKPVDQCEYVMLELPASNVGGFGRLRFKIPAKMWRKK